VYLLNGGLNRTREGKRGQTERGTKGPKKSDGKMTPVEQQCSKITPKRKQEYYYKPDKEYEVTLCKPNMGIERLLFVPAANAVG
jgi:hypothetical protein